MSSNDLARENELLKSRLGELEQQLAEHEHRSAEQSAQLEKALTDLREQTRVLSATLNSITDGVAIADTSGNLTHFNPEARRLLGSMDETASDTWTSQYGLFLPDRVTPFPTEQLPLVRAVGGEQISGVDMFTRNPAQPDGAWIQVSASPIRTEDGALRGGVAIFRDFTERKRAEERERERQEAAEREKNDLLQRLQFAVRELSTPVLEIWDEVLVLPVIGVVDSARSAEMMDRLLEAVEHRQCRFVIIDITGVEVIDSVTAHQFIKLVTAVEYLGARCMLTGTRSAVAQTLVSLGMDLGQLTMLRTLKHGLRECLRQMAKEDVRVGPKAIIGAARDRAAPRLPGANGG